MNTPVLSSLVLMMPVKGRRYNAGCSLINEHSSAQFPGSDDAGEGQELQRRMFSDHARDLQGSGMRQSQPRKRHPPVIGSSDSNKHVKAVTTQWVIDVCFTPAPDDHNGGSERLHGCH